MKDFWNQLLSLKQRDMEPWIVLEDFNEVLYQEEKCGGRMQRPEWKIMDFKNVLIGFELYDLGYS